MRLPEVLGLGAVLGTGAVLYANDQELLDASLRSHQGSEFYRRTIDVGHTFAPLGFMGRTNLYWASALVVGYALRVDLLRTLPAEALESHLIAGGFRQAGEHLVGRKRPFENEGPRSFDGGTSFPSGHASVICEVATLVSHHAHHRAVTILSYGIAATVCLERVDSRNHWPSDVLLGAAYGTYVARTVARRNDERRAAAAAAETGGDSDRLAAGRSSAGGVVVAPWRVGDGWGLQVRFSP